MKILAIIEEWSDAGGGLYATRKWLELLCGRVDVTVLGPRPYGTCKHIYEKLPPQRPHLWLKFPKIKLERIISNYDVVYIPRYAYPAVDTAAKTGVKSVVHLHGYPTYMSTGQKRDWKYEPTTIRRILGAAAAPLIEWLIHRWLAKTDRVICVSKAHCSKIPYRKIQVPNPPPDVPPIEVAEKKKFFVYAGGPRPFKGRDIAKAVAEALGVSLVETGNLPREQYYQLLAEAAALLAPVQWEEPYGYAVVEAMMLGTPPVAFARGAIPELVEGTIAAAFLAEDVAQLTKAAAAALNFKEWKKLAKEAREKFKPEPEKLLKALQWP